MYKYLVLLIVTQLSLTAVAQQPANFQGKININGKPPTGIHYIKFDIPSLGWSEQYNVEINNGIYSTTINFPTNLFNVNTTSREMYITFNGVPIDTVMVYAALERDPTVKSYITDSLFWANIKFKPFIDTSATNELQQLSINGDTVRISDGNYIVLPNTGNNSLTVNGTLTVSDTSLFKSISYAASSTYQFNGGMNQSVWQSFQSKENGKLRQIAFSVATNDSCLNKSITIDIYPGIGVSGQSLGSKIFSVSGGNVKFLTFDFSSNVASSTNGYITLQASKLYTFQVRPYVGCDIKISYNNTNIYPDGISSLGTSVDIPFDIWMDKSITPNFVITKEGSVGIGVDPPTVKLEVNGRIKDQTGYLMPVGSVIAYAGNTIPDGWLLCDGRAMKRLDYPDLFKALGTSWGTYDSTDFILPDMRGVFLRGVDNSPTEGVGGNDPDRATRTTSAPGSNSGNNVGSKQTDEVKSHTHGITASQRGAGTGSSGVVSYLGGNSPGTPTDVSIKNYGGGETRPVNVFVYYIIKY